MSVKAGSVKAGSVKAAEAATRVSAGQLRRLWSRTPHSFRIGFVILLAHGIVAVTGPFWAPYGLAQLGTGMPLSGMPLSGLV